jgi:hypothetical protein
MKTEKISDSLLSWVLGGDVEYQFVRIEEYKGYFRPTYFYLHYLMGDTGCEVIPLDTFIRLAKIKACECGYNFEIDTDNEHLEVGMRDNFLGSIELFMYTSPFDIETDLKALEWVKTEIGEE